MLVSLFLEIAFYIIVLNCGNSKNLYIQTSLMVALSLFRGREGGGPTYKSEVNINRTINEHHLYVFAMF